MMREKKTSEAETMMKIACPHCQVVGEIPTIVLQNSNWPIACHHCHQHYFAPVVSGPEKLARQKKITCSGCKAKAEIDIDKYAAVVACEAALYCPACHDLLPLPKIPPAKNHLPGFWKPRLQMKQKPPHRHPERVSKSCLAGAVPCF